MLAVAARSYRRQPHDEPRTRTAGSPSASVGAGAVFRPDASAMGLDDLLGDRQAEPGILAEALMRAVGVKALEDSSRARRAECRDRHRRPTISIFALRAPADDAHLAAGSSRTIAHWSKRLEMTCPSRESCPGTENVSRRAPSKRDFDSDVVALAWSRLRPTVSVVEQPAHIDRLDVLPLQLRIEAAGVGDVRDQPVEPAHVVLDHREQPRAAVRRILASGRVSTAERIEVSGFFNSCATSAANRSMPSMRL